MTTTHPFHPSAHFRASNDVILMHTQTEGKVRTTLNLDDTLISEARRLTGMSERTALIHEGLRALISRESAKRLARLGGSEPHLEGVPRRRSKGA